MTKTPPTPTPVRWLGFTTAIAVAFGVPVLVGYSVYASGGGIGAAFYIGLFWFLGWILVRASAMMERRLNHLSESHIELLSFFLKYHTTTTPTPPTDAR